MKIASILRTVTVATLLGTVATAANAKAPTLSFIQSSTTPYVWTATFSNSSVSGTFSDMFAFTDPVTPVTLTPGGSANGISLGIQGASVIFDLFQLVDATTSTVLANGTTGGTSSFLNFILPSVTDNYELLVGGHTDPIASTGSYAGNIAISAVPEPRSYAMLLAGLGLIAFTASRKKKSSMAFA